MIITRFPPSPTGFLHLGGARTALFNWLFARKHGGKMVLRIEDTDRHRSEQSYTDAILEALDWLGLDADAGPIFQSERLEAYRAAAERMHKDGAAYYCTCTPERLTELRERQLKAKQKPRYDGHCRDLDLPPTKGAVLRLRTPADGEVGFTDLLCGRVTVANAELDDLILLRADTQPTYNLCVVVDDTESRVSHVIRGDDHINNTPRQLHIFQALGAELPAFAHVPMIMSDKVNVTIDADGKRHEKRERLSKRQGAVNVLAYRDRGYLPDAVLNYLARLGWSDGDKELFSRAELLESFSLDHIHRSAAAFDPDKLLWVNQQHLRGAEARALVEPFTGQLKRLELDPQNGPEPALVIEALRDRADTLEELARQAAYCYAGSIDYDPGDASAHLTPEAAPHLAAARDMLASLSDWDADAIGGALKALAKEREVKLPVLAQPLRVAVAGRAATPGIGLTLALPGRACSLERLDQAIRRLA